MERIARIEKATCMIEDFYDHMNQNRWCVKCKGVFKIKQNGSYQANLVAFGYGQLPRVDMNLIVLLVMIHFEFLAKVVDIKTAFLNGDLEVEMYMECPPCIRNVTKDDCLWPVQGLGNIMRRLYRF